MSDLAANILVTVISFQGTASPVGYGERVEMARRLVAILKSVEFRKSIHVCSNIEVNCGIVEQYAR